MSAYRHRRWGDERVKHVTAEALLAAAEADSAERLKWRVLALLGVSPLSLRGRLLTKRRALRCACQLALDAESDFPRVAAQRSGRDPERKKASSGWSLPRQGEAEQSETFSDARPPSPGGNAGDYPGRGAEANLNFDMARYLALGGLSDGV